MNWPQIIAGVAAMVFGAWLLFTSIITLTKPAPVVETTDPELGGAKKLVTEGAE